MGWVDGFGVGIEAGDVVADEGAWLALVLVVVLAGVRGVPGTGGGSGPGGSACAVRGWGAGGAKDAALGGGCSRGQGADGIAG